MVVADPRIDFLQVIELMIVSCEKGLGPFAIFVYILDYRPCYGHSVIGRSASSYLVQKDQGAFREVVEYHRGLQHLDHEGGLAPGDVVARAHPGENLVAYAYAGRLRRHEGADLGHQHYQGRLPEERRLTRHIRSGEYHNLLVEAVEADVIRDIFLARLHIGLYHRMPSVPYVYAQAHVHLRAAVAVAQGKRGEAAEHIQPCQHPRISLYRGYAGLHP